MRDCLLTLIATATLGNAGVALGQTNINEHLPSTVTSWDGAYKRNFADWKGVMLHCSHYVKSDVLARICENAYASAKYLVVGTNVQLLEVRDGYAALMGGAAGEYLSLRVELFSTKGGSPAAILASIKAYESVVGAVETDPQVATERNPRTRPRTGSMIFWERGVIGASVGDPSQLTEGISQGIHRHLNEFFAAFINARK